MKHFQLKPAWRVSLGGALALAGLVLAAAQPAAADPNWQASQASSGGQNYTTGQIITESLTGDVYSDPSKWQDLSFRDLFRTGWNKPWASPPPGAGGAPRQGWLNADDGVFYRLGIGTFGWQHGLANNSDGYTGGVTMYTPLNQRFEFQTDIPVASNQGLHGNSPSQTNFGDLQITPRLLLSESKELSQTLNVTLRTPTGNTFNGNGVASVSPTYQFWSNYWKGLVVRGGGGFTLPYAGAIALTGARSTFNANLAIGYYMTPHEAVPFGDMVWYVAGNMAQALDNRGPATSSFSVGPGFRTHLGANWYLLGAVDVPVIKPYNYDYQVSGGIMKVF
ncbi:MAG: hypothetical protein ABSB19_03465 [Methylomonas sp.]|jgi:hypothetical protein